VDAVLAAHIAARRTDLAGHARVRRDPPGHRRSVDRGGEPGPDRLPPDAGDPVTPEPRESAVP
jgi:hypothetical protein